MSWQERMRQMVLAGGVVVAGCSNGRLTGPDAGSGGASSGVGGSATGSGGMRGGGGDGGTSPARPVPSGIGRRRGTGSGGTGGSAGAQWDWDAGGGGTGGGGTGGSAGAPWNWGGGGSWTSGGGASGSGGWFSRSRAATPTRTRASAGGRTRTPRRPPFARRKPPAGSRRRLDSTDLQREPGRQRRRPHRGRCPRPLSGPHHERSARGWTPPRLPDSSRTPRPRSRSHARSAAARRRGAAVGADLPGPWAGERAYTRLRRVARAVRRRGARRSLSRAALRRDRRANGCAAAGLRRGPSARAAGAPWRIRCSGRARWRWSKWQSARQSRWRCFAPVGARHASPWRARRWNGSWSTRYATSDSGGAAADGLVAGVGAEPNAARRCRKQARGRRWARWSGESRRPRCGRLQANVEGFEPAFTQSWASSRPSPAWTRSMRPSSGWSSPG